LLMSKSQMSKSQMSKSQMSRFEISNEMSSPISLPILQGVL
jgi:hypothetical protein